MLDLDPGELRRVQLHGDEPAGRRGHALRLRGRHSRHSLDARRLLASGNPAGLADWNNLPQRRRRTGQHLALRRVSRILRQDARRSSACTRSSLVRAARRTTDSQCTVEFVAEPGPLTLCRVTQDPDGGWHAVVARAASRTVPRSLSAATAGAASRTCSGSTATCCCATSRTTSPSPQSHVGNALWEALGNYLGMNVYHATQETSGAVHAATAVLGPCRQSRQTSRRWALDHSGNPK